MRSSGRERKATRRYTEDIDDSSSPIPAAKKQQRRRKPPVKSKEIPCTQWKDKASKNSSPTAPKKQNKNPAAGSALHRKTKKGISYYIKPKQKPQISFVTDESTSADIHTVTAAQISKAAKKQYRPTKKDKESLVQIPSHLNRAKIYKDAAKAIAKKEAMALPSHGARPWFVQIIMTDEQGACGMGSSADLNTGIGDDRYEILKGFKGKKSHSPLFVWNKYHLEFAVLPHILDGIDEIDTNHGLLKSVKEEVLEMELELEEGYVTDDDDYIKNLMQRKVTLLSTVASQDASFVIPTIERKWMSPDSISFRTRNAAVQHSLMLLDRDKLIDRALHGIGSRGSLLRPVKPTRTMALEAGYLRFVRDGLWVVGQEEEWIGARIALLDQQQQQEEKEEEQQQEYQQEQQQPPQPQQQPQPQHQQDGSSKQDEQIVEKEVSDCGISSDVVVKDEERNGKDDSNDNCRSDGGTAQRRAGGNSEEGIDTSISEIAAASTQLESERLNAESHSSNDEQSDGCAKTIVDSTEPQTTSDADGNIVPEVASYKLSTSPMCVGSRVLSVSYPEVSMDENITEKNSERTDAQSDSEGCKAIADARKDVKLTKPKKKVNKKRQHSFVPSTHWRLTPKQIVLCYNAVMDHYEQVMHTVKAKALHSELADGFDVFRERGRGRYDMTMDAFNTPEYSFLEDLSKVAWMPVVKKILGDDATLVHKGAFLSIPGAETQVYHQDGVHLNKKHQKSCHAINVFIPLVDLHEKNGPTEFCIGTHYLGYEDYNKNLIDIPLAKAGNPVIFDYRLGHRGLGNNSREPRPVLYLTYTRASKEFRDAVNFSSKRYRKLGEMVEKGMSREERALKRTREL